MNLKEFDITKTDGYKDWYDKIGCVAYEIMKANYRGNLFEECRNDITEEEIYNIKLKRVMDNDMINTFIKNSYYKYLYENK